jgi:hypothetical protein
MAVLVVARLLKKATPIAGLDSSLFGQFKHLGVFSPARPSARAYRWPVLLY